MTKEEREKAIDLLDNLLGMVEDNQNNDYDKALRMGIKALEQEPRKDEIILTKEEYGELLSSEFDNGYAKGYREAMEEQESCEDAVSRTEIRQKINKLWNSNGDKNYCMETLKDFVTDLPPVTPTRKVGKWICVHHIENKITYDSWKCSECQHDFNSEEESMVNFDEYKHCPNCGAEMERVNGRISF